MTLNRENLQRATDAIRAADGLIITAGAGMGVDSGLPDFRGPEGFWGVYPALGKAKIPFESIANPAAFRSNLQRAWGFYGHRLAMYRNVEPGPSFAILQSIAAKLPHRAFVFTSNVDGHFQKAGFSAERVWECHGSIHYLQCLEGCRRNIWPAKDFIPDVDPENCLLLSEPPHCPHCGALARPNILMFGDWDWVDDRERMQGARYHAWRAKVRQPVVIEIGAGASIPTVRRFSERQTDSFLIRINPTEPSIGSARGLGIPLSGHEALKAIAMALLESGWGREGG